MGRDESSLYAGIAARDDAAFGALIEPYQHQLAWFVGRQLVGDTRAVDDVLQEAYLSAYRAIVARSWPALAPCTSSPGSTRSPAETFAYLSDDRGVGSRLPRSRASRR